MSLTLPSFKIVSKNEAKRLSYRYDYSPSHVIQILDSGEQFPSFVGASRLRLNFQDVIDRESLVRWNDWTPPTIKDIEAIIEFGKKMDLNNSLFHCFAGISRSPAAAIIAMASQYGDISEYVAPFYQIFPHTRPNRLMLEYAAKYFPSVNKFVLDNFINDSKNRDNNRPLWH